MPWRNRVNPFGEIEAVAERGSLLGNRGCLINRRRELVRQWQLERWICCRLAFKGRRHPVMTPGLWTELFFLDEATAFAAGHRPCCECRRADAQRFLRLWNDANIKQLKRFPLLDRELHVERLGATHQLTLANGVLVADRSQPLLYWEGRFHPWTYAGYQPPREPDGPLRQLTPASIARTFLAGYTPSIHPTLART